VRVATFIKRTTFHKGFGGLETQNKILCEGLVSKGHSVTVFSPKYELNVESAEENGVNYVFVDCVYRSLAGFSKFQKKNWINKSVEVFEKYHTNNAFDVILAQSSAGLGVIGQKNKLDIPVVSISHGSIVGEYKTRLQSLRGFTDYIRLIPDTAYLLLNFFGRQREFVLHSNKIIAVSEAVKSALVNETYVPKEKVTVIHNSFDASDVPHKDDDFHNEKPILIYVGRVVKSKGIKDLIDAFKMCGKNAKLLIVGDGADAELFKKHVSKLRLEESVEFLGLRPHSEVLDLVSGADLFVLPSRRVEGFPMTIVESLAAGTPIIGADIGGISEGIDEGITGLLYESGDVRALCEKLSILLDDKFLRAKMSQNARAVARQRFSLDAMLNKYESVLMGVIKR